MVAADYNRTHEIAPTAREKWRFMMASPFPGIDPYLESQHFWEDFHARFLTYLCDALNDALPEGYVAQLGERLRMVELTQPKSKSVRPDVAVIRGRRRSTRGNAPAVGAAAATHTLEPVTIPFPEVAMMEVRDVWIEIGRRPARSPVTVIEVLSPTNKTGDGFFEYKSKRLSLIRQKINLVELDFLLGGQRLPMSRPLPAGDYYAFVARAERRPDSEVYAWTLRDRLPVIPIPLVAPDSDVKLDLSGVFATAYDRGRYARLIDYGTNPSLPRNPESRAWAVKTARRARR
jgi:Protein of unknown function (DUF4058)